VGHKIPSPILFCLKCYCICFHPLPTFRKIEFVLSILRKRSLTELTVQFLLGNSLQMRLAPHPFCWQISSIDALSSNVKWRYAVFPIVFPVELGCFHLFYPITKLLKVFARDLHILLTIDYILTCVIHFKCTLKSAAKLGRYDVLVESRTLKIFPGTNTNRLCQSSFTSYI